MSADEYQISMAGGDGDPLEAIQRRADDPENIDQPDVPYLLALVRAQQATIAAVLALANAHGRQGFLVAPADIRATLAP